MGSFLRRRLGAIPVKLLELTPVGASVSTSPLLTGHGSHPTFRRGVGGIQPNNGFTADLAQAQAQLQSLQQFRAAAGGHHHKMPSFSFPNMLPNMMAANMMGLGLGGINLLQQQQQQFQSSYNSSLNASHYLRLISLRHLFRRFLRLESW